MTYRAEGDIATTLPAERQYRTLLEVQRIFSRDSNLQRSALGWGHTILKALRVTHEVGFDCVLNVASQDL